MKFNIQNTIKRVTSFFTAVIVFVATLCIPAFAADVNGNEFIDIDDYAKYTFSQDNTYVTCSMSFPRWWNVTTAYGYNWKPTIGVFKGGQVSFDTTEDYLSLILHPFDGRNLGAYPPVGKQVQSAYFLSLDSFPQDTIMRYSFSIRVSDDVTVPSNPYRVISYVDSNGVVLSTDVQQLSFGCLVDDSGFELILSDSFALSSFDSNSTAAGFILTYFCKNMELLYDRTTEITLGEFTLSFPISSLQYEAQQNEKMQNTLDSVKNALEEQGKKMDDILNGTPEQNEQVNGAVGDLNDKADDLGALGDQMASVEKPEINSADFSADKLVPKTSLLALSAPFHALWENNTLLAMLSIVVALVLVSWIFFGKKG